MNKAFKCVAWVTIVAGLALALYTGYILTFPFVISETKLTVLSKTVKNGGMLTLKTDYCKYKDLPAISTRQLVDGVVIELPPSNTNLPVGCNSVVRFIPLPTGIPQGEYRYQTTVTYEISPLRKVRHTTISDPFHVE